MIWLARNTGKSGWLGPLMLEKNAFSGIDYNVLLSVGGGLLQLITQIAPIVGGSGGGRPDFAQAGGKDPSKLDEALAKVATLIR